VPSAAPSTCAPAWSWAPPATDTLGPEVADLASLAGFAPDPEQRDALDVIFGFVGGRAAARDVAIVCPRQNMKTGLLKMCALGWLYITEDRLTVWSAHEFGTALEAFRDMCELIENTPDLEREVQHIHRTSGAEAIELRDGRRLRFKARTKGGGRGLTGNRIVLDEAMYLRPEHMGALVPTLRAVPDPQLVYAGSAGMLTSDVWRSVRDRGRAGADPSLAYLEWADPDEWACPEGCSHALGSGCAMDDEARWWRSNPALGGRIDIESLRADRRTLPAIEFARETLGWWEDPPADGVDEALASWGDCHDPQATPLDPVHLAIDVSPNMASGAIVAAGWDDTGRAVVEVVEHRRGTAWIAPRFAELLERHHPASWGLAAGSPAAALVPDLPEGGTELRAAEVVAACATFARAVADGQVAHRGDKALDGAVLVARRKFSGDGWRWSRRDSDGDIAPLYAATVARHLLAVAAEPYDPLANLW
jgi:hypothetical protein